MTKRTFVFTAWLVALTTTTFAAPAMKSAGAPLPPPDLQTGVTINAITRNDTASQTNLALAKDGAALLPIVISGKASDATKAVAADLKKVLGQISGADFPIETGDGTSGIVVGSLRDFPIPALNKALEIKHDVDGRGAYAIRTRPGKLLLLGATDLGASHAAYRFLEELGCRWFFPDATGDWTVIPSIGNLNFARDITDRPAFLERRIWYAWDWFVDANHPLGPERNSRADFNDWARRNSMTSAFVTNTGHAYETIARENAAEFEKHPEYWALVTVEENGKQVQKHQGPQFDVGNPALRQLVIDWAVDYFKKNPKADMVSVDPADGPGVSETPETKAYGQGNAANASFMLANDVAKALQKAYPGQNKLVGMYAYSWHSDPPPFKLEPNVYIQLTMGYNEGALTLDQLFEQWPQKAKNLGFYDYYSTWRHDYDLWPKVRVGNKYYAPSMIRRFQAANARSNAYATSISAESSGNWGVSGRSYYLANKLMWNPQLDEDVILEDFYSKAFGPAAAAMKKYYSVQDSSPPISPGVVGALFRAMSEARLAAQGNPVVMQRLDDLSMYLHFYDTAYRGGDANMLEHWRSAYRSRYKYMTHWAAIYNDALGNNADPKAPWRDETPITREEINGWIEDGVQHYPELKVPTQIKFSDQLVPVDFGGTGKNNNQLYQEGSWYLVLSRTGEPIHLRFQPGDAYGGLRQNVTIKDLNGKLIKEFKPVPGKEITMDVAVPGPGVYRFDYLDGGAYHRIFWDADQIVSLPLNIGGFRAMEAVGAMYFYVPRGTREINYYYKRVDWQHGGPHQIIDPSGQVIKEVDVNGDYISVPVAPGMDGKVWKIGGNNFGLGQFRFFNVPDYFSPNPNVMLLPKDVVQKDGLQLLR